MRAIVDDEQRRRRAVTPCRPLGCGGEGPSRALPRLDDGPHRLRRGALHPAPRRPQRDPRDFYHGLLGAAERIRARER